MPLFSQASHSLPSGFSKSSLEALTKRVQFGGDEVVKAKDGAGSATLSMAYAGADFADKVLRALKGEKGLVTPSFVHLTSDKAGGEKIKKEIGQEIEYFSVPVELGVGARTYRLACSDVDDLWQPEGVASLQSLGPINEYEKSLIAAAVPDLSGNIDKVSVKTTSDCSFLTQTLDRVSPSLNLPSCRCSRSRREEK